jgi:hypothetical protein
MGVKCTAVRKDGLPCRAWAVAGSDPPRCAAHGGKRPPACLSDMLPGFDLPTRSDTRAGSPRPGPLDRSDQSSITAEEAVSFLAALLKWLADYMATHAEEFTVDDVARLSAVYGQNVGRYVRMCQDQARSAGRETDEMEQALRLAGQYLGVELLPTPPGEVPSTDHLGSRQHRSMTPSDSSDIQTTDDETDRSIDPRNRDLAD